MKLNVTLNDEATKRFQAVKEYYGFKANTSLVGVLLAKEADRIQEERMKRISIPNERYEALAKEAKARGLDVDEYVNKIVTECLKEAEEKTEA